MSSVINLRLLLPFSYASPKISTRGPVLGLLGAPELFKLPLQRSRRRSASTSTVFSSSSTSYKTPWSRSRKIFPSESEGNNFRVRSTCLTSVICLEDRDPHAMKLAYLLPWVGMVMLGAASLLEEIPVTTTTTEDTASVTVEAAELSATTTLPTQTDASGTPTVSGVCVPGRECIDKVTFCGTSTIYYGGYVFPPVFSPKVLL